VAATRRLLWRRGFSFRSSSVGDPITSPLFFFPFNLGPISLSLFLSFQFFPKQEGDYDMRKTKCSFSFPFSFHLPSFSFFLFFSSMQSPAINAREFRRDVLLFSLSLVFRWLIGGARGSLLSVKLFAALMRSDRVALPFSLWRPPSVFFPSSTRQM